MHLVGFIVRIYHGARSPERQKEPYTLRHQLSFQKGQGHVSAVTPRSTPGATQSIVLMIARDGRAAVESEIVWGSLYTPPLFEP